MKFFTAFVIVPSFIVATFADVTTVHNDIAQKIAPQITTLMNDLNAFPDSGLVGALAIHSDAKDLVTMVDEATTDVQNTGSFDTVSGTTIVADVQALLFPLSDALRLVVHKKPDFERLPDFEKPAEVLIELQNLKKAFYAFMKVVVKNVPKGPNHNRAIVIRKRMNMDFGTAIAAYSN